MTPGAWLFLIFLLVLALGGGGGSSYRPLTGDPISRPKGPLPMLDDEDELSGLPKGNLPML
jgi:hypothetical protein